MATQVPGNLTDLERDDLEQLVKSLHGQLQAATGPNPVDPHEENRPWNVAAQHVGEEHTRDRAPLPYRGPGSVIHHFPHLTGGSGGPQDGPYVRAIAELLAELGYTDNDVIAGRLDYFDNTLAGDVARFSRDHDAREHVDAYRGLPDPPEDVAKRLVGPYTIQALFDAVAEERGQDVAAVVGQKEYEIRNAQAHRR